MWDWGYLGPEGLMMVLVPIMAVGLVVVLVLGINALYPRTRAPIAARPRKSSS